jgi:hypothetical protein
MEENNLENPQLSEEEMREEKPAWDKLLLVTKRNEMLNKSDKYLVSDFPISAAQKKEIIAWRKALYAMENDAGFIADGVFEFPPKPDMTV